LNRRLVPAAVALASLCAASTAVAAADSPAIGKWKGSNDSDSVGFKISKSKSAYKATSVKLKTTASCENPNDPSGPVSARLLKLTLPGGTLNRKDGSRKLTTSITRKLSANRRQTVTTTIKLTGNRTGKVSSKIKDDVTGSSPLRCRSTVSLKVKPAS
jgi:hypothetical protein